MRDIQLTLVYGQSDSQNAMKKDEATLPWAIRIKNKYIKVGSRDFLWQPCLGHLKNCDLVIMEQANKLLVNYMIIMLRYFYKYQSAFWGHGRNRQTSKGSFGNLFKQYMISSVEWWFAYTSGVKDFLGERGFNPNRITVVQNAVNTNKMNAIYDSISDNEVVEIRNRYGVFENSKVGIYCGGIYKEKQIDFLIGSCDRIHEKAPEFILFIIGAGNEAYKLIEASNTRPWMKYLGPMFEREKIEIFKISDLFLMPGLVGLAVLDSFALKTPMITTNYPYHSPEIEYLQNQVNGLITDNNIDAYVDECLNVLSDAEYRQNLVAGCVNSYKYYTVERMAENYANGIISCLGIRGEQNQASL